MVFRFRRRRRFVVVRLHGGEEEDLLDVVGVGEEHRQAVDAHAPAAGGGEAESKENVMRKRSFIKTLFAPAKVSKMFEQS